MIEPTLGTASGLQPGLVNFLSRTPCNPEATLSQHGNHVTKLGLSGSHCVCLSLLREWTDYHGLLTGSDQDGEGQRGASVLLGPPGGGQGSGMLLFLSFPKPALQSFQDSPASRGSGQQRLPHPCIHSFSTSGHKGDRLETLGLAGPPPNTAVSR